MMRIVEARPLDHFRVALRFSNDVSGTVDLREMAGRGVFSAWLTPGVFEQVRISEQGALEWPGDLDLCPDALYQRMNFTGEVLQ